MAKRVGIEVSIACAEAVRLANVDVVPAYPITPQTHIVEDLSQLVADGELDAAFIPVESEHSAMSTALGSAAAGARVFTATSSQGLALMHEIVMLSPSLRLPVVMVVANRALSGPISIWNDHSDIMAERDCGWVQIFCENGQEVFDLTLVAFNVVEDERVLLPIMVNLDGFQLSHMIEPIEILNQEEADTYLRPHKAAFRLDVDNPSTMGPVGLPEYFSEAKMAADMALKGSREVVEEELKKFGDTFGRYYNVVETYKAERAEVIILTMGSISETAMTAIDKMRSWGRKVGLVRIRLWRPFPVEEFVAAVRGAEVIACIDRAVTFGGTAGPVASEVRSCLYHLPDKPAVINFVAGLGGRDVTVDDFVTMVDRAQHYLRKGIFPPYELINIAGEEEKEAESA